MRKPNLSVMYVGLLVILIAVLGRYVLPVGDLMFSFHDSTQAARVVEFTRSLQAGHFPPRLSGNMSFGLGYPVFNFYAPTSYWITSVFHVVGLDVASAIKASFLVALMVGGVSTYFLLATYFTKHASFLGSMLFVSSPYLALEIFVRGNLAELWLICLLPLVLWCVRFLSLKASRKVFVLLVLSFSLMLTAHNALSIIAAGFVCVLASVHANKKLLFSGMALGTGLASYFLLPAILELKMVHAQAVAVVTKYSDHFLCLKQIWSSQWGFGGSTAGCIDGMSFMLGKVLLLTALIGGGLWLYKSHRRSLGRSHVVSDVLFGGLGVASVLMAYPTTSTLWAIASPALSVFQFPWRFLALSLLSLAYFAAMSADFIKTEYAKKALIVVLSLLAVYSSMKYFVPNPQKTYSKSDFTSQYASDSYIRNEVAYRVPEYVPAVADYEFWQSLDGQTEILEGLEKSIEPLDGQQIVLDDHAPYLSKTTTHSQYFAVNKYAIPHWQIEINGNMAKPEKIDEFGRPVFRSDSVLTTVTVMYSQTPLEKFGNALTILSIILLAMSVQWTIWKRLSH